MTVTKYKRLLVCQTPHLTSLTSDQQVVILDDRGGQIHIFGVLCYVILVSNKNLVKKSMKLFKKDLNKRTSRNQIMDRVRFLCKMSQRSIETKEPETETGREPVREAQKEPVRARGN